MLFFYLRPVKIKSVDECSNLVIKEASSFWHKAQIPIKEDHHSAKKLVKLYQNWQKLEKSKNRNLPSNITNGSAFTENLDNLFDIALASALEDMKIEEDKQFLIQQREKGRPGHMYGLDWELARKEARSAEQEQLRIHCRRKHNETMEKLGKFLFVNVFGKLKIG